MYQNPLASMQYALVPFRGVLLSEEFVNHTKFDVQISLALYLSKLIRITVTNNHFKDKLLKKVFQVIVTSFQVLLIVLTDHTTSEFAYLSP